MQTWRMPVVVLLLASADLVAARSLRQSNGPNEFSQPRRALAGYAMDDSSIRTAVAAWFDDRSGAEATYGHISTWKTGGVTDMSWLFCVQSVECWEDSGCWDVSPHDLCVFTVQNAVPWGGGNDCSYAVYFESPPCFNDDITAWDTSGVTSMRGMFFNAAAFDQPIGDWRVDKVTDMRTMFEGASAFNGPLINWRVHNVKDMNHMFYHALAFNQPLNDWRVDNVTDMKRMFSGASSFDQDLGWCVDDDVRLVEAFFYTPCACPICCGVFHTAALSCGGTPMGDGSIRSAVAAWLWIPTTAEATYGHITTWATGGVTDMSQLFYSPRGSSFNDDISAWDTSGVTTFRGMFIEAKSFNQDIGDWRLDKVTDMRGMFKDAKKFDQDLGWCVDDDVLLEDAFSGTQCYWTACGVAQRVLGICVLILIKYILIIVLALLVLAGAYVRCWKEKDETCVAASRRLLCPCGTGKGKDAPATDRTASTTSEQATVHTDPRPKYIFTDATLDEIRKAVTTLEDEARTARQRRDPNIKWIEATLQDARRALSARETQSAPAAAPAAAPPRGAASPAPAETLAEMLLRKENARLRAAAERVPPVEAAPSVPSERLVPAPTEQV